MAVAGLLGLSLFGAFGPGVKAEAASVKPTDSINLVAGDGIGSSIGNWFSGIFDFAKKGAKSVKTAIVDQSAEDTVKNELKDGVPWTGGAIKDDTKGVTPYFGPNGSIDDLTNKGANQGTHSKFALMLATMANWRMYKTYDNIVASGLASATSLLREIMAGIIFLLMTVTDLFSAMLGQILKWVSSMDIWQYMSWGNNSTPNSGFGKALAPILNLFRDFQSFFWYVIIPLGTGWTIFRLASSTKDREKIFGKGALRLVISVAAMTILPLAIASEFNYLGKFTSPDGSIGGFGSREVEAFIVDDSAWVQNSMKYSMSHLGSKGSDPDVLNQFMWPSNGDDGANHLPTQPGDLGYNATTGIQNTGTNGQVYLTDDLIFEINQLSGFDNEKDAQSLLGNWGSGKPMSYDDVTVYYNSKATGTGTAYAVPDKQTTPTIVDLASPKSQEKIMNGTAAGPKMIQLADKDSSSDSSSSDSSDSESSVDDKAKSANASNSGFKQLNLDKDDNAAAIYESDITPDGFKYVGTAVHFGLKTQGVSFASAIFPSMGVLNAATRYLRLVCVLGVVAGIELMIFLSMVKIVIKTVTNIFKYTAGASLSGSAGMFVAALASLLTCEINLLLGFAILQAANSIPDIAGNLMGSAAAVFDSGSATATASDVTSIMAYIIGAWLLLKFRSSIELWLGLMLDRLTNIINKSIDNTSVMQSIDRYANPVQTDPNSGGPGIMGRASGALMNRAPSGEAAAGFAGGLGAAMVANSLKHSHDSPDGQPGDGKSAKSMAKDQARDGTDGNDGKTTADALNNQAANDGDGRDLQANLHSSLDKGQTAGSPAAMQSAKENLDHQMQNANAAQQQLQQAQEHANQVASDPNASQTDKLAAQQALNNAQRSAADAQQNVGRAAQQYEDSTGQHLVANDQRVPAQEEADQARQDYYAAQQHEESVKQQLLEAQQRGATPSEIIENQQQLQNAQNATQAAQQRMQQTQDLAKSFDPNATQSAYDNVGQAQQALNNAQTQQQLSQQMAGMSNADAQQMLAAGKQQLNAAKATTADAQQSLDDSKQNLHDLKNGKTATAAQFGAAEQSVAANQQALAQAQGAQAATQENVNALSKAADNSGQIDRAQSYENGLNEQVGKLDGLSNKLGANQQLTQQEGQSLAHMAKQQAGVGNKQVQEAGAEVQAARSNLEAVQNNPTSTTAQRDSAIQRLQAATSNNQAVRQVAAQAQKRAAFTAQAVQNGTVTPQLVDELQSNAQTQARFAQTSGQVAQQNLLAGSSVGVTSAVQQIAQRQQQQFAQAQSQMSIAHEQLQQQQQRLQQVTQAVNNGTPGFTNRERRVAETAYQQARTNYADKVKVLQANKTQMASYQQIVDRAQHSQQLAQQASAIKHQNLIKAQQNIEMMRQNSGVTQQTLDKITDQVENVRHKYK